MSHVVRRATDEINSPSAEMSYPKPTVRCDQELTVKCQKVLGVQPRALFNWSADESCWRDGCKLMVFRSETGFAANRDTRNLSEHGPMILEERADGSFEEYLTEGTHFYTFLLLRLKWFKLFEVRCIVRFSENVPSARTAVSRIEDQLKLKRMQTRHKLDRVLDKVAYDEAVEKRHKTRARVHSLTNPPSDSELIEEGVRREVEPLVRKALIQARTRVEMTLQLEKLRKDLKKYPGWKQLGKDQREKILEDIARDLDADEAAFKE